MFGNMAIVPAGELYPPVQNAQARQIEVYAKDNQLVVDLFSNAFKQLGTSFAGINEEIKKAHTSYQAKVDKICDQMMERVGKAQNAEEEARFLETAEKMMKMAREGTFGGVIDTIKRMSEADAGITEEHYDLVQEAVEAKMQIMKYNSEELNAIVERNKSLLDVEKQRVEFNSQREYLSQKQLNELLEKQYTDCLEAHKKELALAQMMIEKTKGTSRYFLESVPPHIDYATKTVVAGKVSVTAADGSSCIVM